MFTLNPGLKLKQFIDCGNNKYRIDSCYSQIDGSVDLSDFIDKSITIIIPASIKYISSYAITAIINTPTTFMGRENKIAIQFEHKTFDDCEFDVLAFDGISKFLCISEHVRKSFPLNLTSCFFTIANVNLNVNIDGDVKKKMCDQINLVEQKLDGFYLYLTDARNAIETNKIHGRKMLSEQFRKILELDTDLNTIMNKLTN